MLNNSFTTSEKGLELIKHYEGFSAQAYKCPANIWTIGYGHTAGVTEGQTITAEQGEQLLKKDLAHAERSVNSLVKVTLNQSQFDALVSFVFNLGSGNFQSSTLLKKLNQQDFDGAALEFKKWVKSNGSVLPGLVKRRNSEAELFSTGVLVFD